METTVGAPVLADRQLRLPAIISVYHGYSAVPAPPYIQDTFGGKAAVVTGVFFVTYGSGNHPVASRQDLFVEE